MTQPPNLPRNLRGELLHAGDYAALEKRWLDRDTVEAALLRRFHSLDGAELVGVGTPTTIRASESHTLTGRQFGIPTGRGWASRWRVANQSRL